jgi:hypothetical protein
LLNVANIKLTAPEIKKLGTSTMNGREIKNAIRIAQCIAMESKLPLTYKIISEAIVLKSDLNEGK